MSIVDSQVERAEAEVRLGAADQGELIRDLTYWEMARGDHIAEYNDLTGRRNQVERMHAEAVTWVSMIVEELRNRRDARKAS